MMRTSAGLVMVLVAACGGGGGDTGDAAGPGIDANEARTDGATPGFTWTLQRTGVAATCDEMVPIDGAEDGDVEIALFAGDGNARTAEVRVPCTDGGAELAAPDGTYRMEVRYGAGTGDQYAEGWLFLSEPITFPLTTTRALVLNQVDVTWTWDPKLVPDCAGNFMRIEVDREVGFTPTCMDGQITPAQGAHVAEGTWRLQAIVGPASFPQTHIVEEQVVPATGGEVALPIP